MLQITNTVINKDAQIVKNNITYAVHYIISNGVLSSVQCAISDERDGQFIQIGYIRKESGRINIDFQEGVVMTEQLSVFEEITLQIETDVMQLTPKSK